MRPAIQRPVLLPKSHPHLTVLKASLDYKAHKDLLALKDLLDLSEILAREALPVNKVRLELMVLTAQTASKGPRDHRVRMVCIPLVFLRLTTVPLVIPARTA